MIHRPSIWRYWPSSCMIWTRTTCSVSTICIHRSRTLWIPFFWRPCTKTSKICTRNSSWNRLWARPRPSPMRSGTTLRALSRSTTSRSTSRRSRRSWKWRRTSSKSSTPRTSAAAHNWCSSNNSSISNRLTTRYRTSLTFSKMLAIPLRKTLIKTLPRAPASITLLLLPLPLSRRLSRGRPV